MSLSILKIFILISFLTGFSYADPENKKLYERRMHLEEIAISGNVNAIFDLGNHYALYHDAQLAEKWFLKAGDKGHVPSLWKLTHIARKNSADVNYNLLKSTLFKLRSRGVLESLTQLAQLYSNPDSPFYNKTNAMLYFNEAVLADQADAELALGLLYMGRDGFKADYLQAISLFKKAAKHSNLKAMRMLGLCFRYGLGLNKNTERAWEWYEKASRKGDAESIFTIGEALYSGEDIVKNKNRALLYFKLSAKKGYKPAQRKLKELQNFN